LIPEFEDAALKYDKFDIALLVVMVVFLGAAGMLLSAASPVSAPAQNRALERALATQARLLFIQNTYAPVEALTRAGRHQEALLKLEELSGRFPGEAHGLLLKAASLAALGAEAPAIASYAAAVRLQGEYVDQKSPLSHRDEIERLTKSVAPAVASKLKSQPDDPGLKQTQRDLNYLKSRLAGGCE
jgi:hypothetical protein